EGRHAAPARSLAPAGEHNLPCVDGFITAWADHVGPDQCACRKQPPHFGVVLDGNADGIADPDEVSEPVETRDLVEVAPAAFAMLRLEPGAKGQGGNAKIGPG